MKFGRPAVFADLKKILHDSIKTEPCSVRMEIWGERENLLTNLPSFPLLDSKL